jgi:hypothetical protein
MPFSEAINKAKAADTAVGDKAPNSRANPSPPVPQSPVHGSQRGNDSTAASAEDEDEDKDEDMTLGIPGSFDVENNGVATGADAVSVLGDLWRRM